MLYFDYVINLIKGRNRTMTDNELLLAISNMMDEKLEPVKDDVKR